VRQLVSAAMTTPRRLAALAAAAALIAVTAAVAVAQTSHDVDAWQTCMADGGWTHAAYATCEDALFPPQTEPVEYHGWVPAPTTTAPPYHESNHCWPHAGETYMTFAALNAHRPDGTLEHAHWYETFSMQSGSCVIPA